MKSEQFVLKCYKLAFIIVLIFLIIGSILYKNKKFVINNTIVKEVINPNYVFLGDSITNLYKFDKYYKDLPIVNSGIDGNKTADILNNLEERVYRYNPSKLILLIGINDLLYENHDEQISKDIEKITSKIAKKLPNCSIYIESVYPMNKNWDTYVEIEDIEKLNDKIKKICKKHDYQYIDVFSHLIDDSTGMLNEKYTNDGLHPNETGYDVITEVIGKYIEEDI